MNNQQLVKFLVGFQLWQGEPSNYGKELETVAKLYVSEWNEKNSVPDTGNTNNQTEHYKKLSELAAIYINLSRDENADNLAKYKAWIDWGVMQNTPVPV